MSDAPAGVSRTGHESARTIPDMATELALLRRTAPVTEVVAMEPITVVAVTVAAVTTKAAAPPTADSRPKPCSAGHHRITDRATAAVAQRTSLLARVNFVP
jgi:hypothetical protein